MQMLACLALPLLASYFSFFEKYNDSNKHVEWESRKEAINFHFCLGLEMNSFVCCGGVLKQLLKFNIAFPNFISNTGNKIRNMFFSFADVSTAESESSIGKIN